MKHMLKLLGGSVLGLACLAGAARAELVLSGTTAGYFAGVSGPETEIVNAPDGSTASFRTGVPIPGSFRSGIVFENQDFAGIQNGDTFGFGFVTYYNGITQIGTSSAEAMLDFYLDLDDPAMDPILLTTITFGIDATVNTPAGTNPDTFTASFTQPPPVMIGGQWVQFTITGLPEVLMVAENTWTELADVTVTFLSPIPEPSTYGLIGAAALLGLVAYRRYRGRQTASDPALPAALA